MQSAPFRQLPGDQLPPASAFWVKADDGIRLRMGLWQAIDAADRVRGTVLLFPGRTEYIEKYNALAADLNAAGYFVLGIDWRGQGMSDRLQVNARLGHVAAFADYQRDVVEMVLAGVELDLPRPWHLLGHSMGGCIGLGALYGDLPVERAVFSAPMWGIELGQLPHRIVIGVSALAGRLGHGDRLARQSGTENAYLLDEPFNNNLLTSNVDSWARMLREAAAWPELTLGGVSYSWLFAALAECRRLSILPPPDRIPMMVAVGTNERIVRPQAIRARADAWPGAHLVEIDGAQHELMMETPERRDRFIAAMLAHLSPD